LRSVRERIEALFNEVITPLVEADGGGVELVDVTDGVVKVRMVGAYRGCPSVPSLLRGVLEPAVRHVMGTQTKVELVV
jgi:Fe-S cluster biogenesis protein NfuA